MSVVPRKVVFVSRALHIGSKVLQFMMQSDESIQVLSINVVFKGIFISVSCSFTRNSFSFSINFLKRQKQCYPQFRHVLKLFLKSGDPQTLSIGSS